MTKEEQILVDLALQMAVVDHAGQTREDGATPYITHPIAVFALLRTWGVEDVATLAAALLHDVLEDTELTEADLRVQMYAYGFPALVAKVTCEHVVALTNPKEINDAPYNNLKAIEHTLLLHKGGPSVVVIKVADCICNTREFLTVDVERARRFLEKVALTFRIFEGERTRFITDRLSHIHFAATVEICKLFGEISKASLR